MRITTEVPTLKDRFRSPFEARKTVHAGQSIREQLRAHLLATTKKPVEQEPALVVKFSGLKEQVLACESSDVARAKAIAEFFSNHEVLKKANQSKLLSELQAYGVTVVNIPVRRLELQAIERCPFISIIPRPRGLGSRLRSRDEDGESTKIVVKLPSVEDLAAMREVADESSFEKLPGVGVKISLGNGKKEIILGNLNGAQADGREKPGPNQSEILINVRENYASLHPEHLVLQIKNGEIFLECRGETKEFSEGKLKVVRSVALKVFSAAEYAEEKSRTFALGNIEGADFSNGVPDSVVAVKLTAKIDSVNHKRVVMVSLEKVGEVGGVNAAKINARLKVHSDNESRVRGATILV